MGDRYSVLAVVFGFVSFALGILVLPASGQPVQPADATAATVASPVAHTPWGVPDLQGIWDFRTITPLQRPDDLVDKTVFTPEEAAEYAAARVASLHKDQRVEDGLKPETDVAYAYNHFWWDYGDTLVEDRRTSLIVDPSDGKIPPLTPDGELRGEQRREARSRPAHGPEDRNVWERCIVGGNAGPPITPSAYNNNVQLLQAPGVVTPVSYRSTEVRTFLMTSASGVVTRAGAGKVRPWLWSRRILMERLHFGGLVQTCV